MPIDEMIRRREVKESKVGTYVCKCVSRERFTIVLQLCVFAIAIFLKPLGSIRLIKAFIPMELKIVSLN
jgi:hypothetical protein